ncbi:hypothetical protein [Dictyobacter aurantiacus]|uniref:Uncharacterized protein n=1 Tax=Dictyobacter aurantiacus TaxID=1936993 RepID=A0A401ZFA2_9CHLR|nr:hypothetical protein [Dictyobacter aurantiacus]GCE05571.1 hypothetical protein KDAU_29000 [Dictyobacter aurantiacus]
MTTTGELRSIIEELELVDAGDAANYLGDDAASAEEAPDMAASNLARCLRYIASADDCNYTLY